MNHPCIHILVVDDELTARLLMQAVLEKSGFKVHLAENGEDALRQIRTQPFNLIMLDVNMPDMNGYQVCTQLRQEMGNELPIIMVTGMDDHESIEQAFSSGATDFIAKPISWKLIGHRVKYLLRAHQILQDLHTSNARNLAILNAIPDLLFEMTLEGRYLDCHSPHDHLLAAPSNQLFGRTVTEILPPDAAASCLSALREAHEKGLSIGKQFELSLPQGTYWFELSVSPKKDRSAQTPTFIVLSRDITSRKEAENKIYHLAYIDPITGLHNRLSFSDRLEREIQRATHQNNKLAVLFLDLNGFKKVNDTLGHSAGDLLLQWVSDRLLQVIRPADMVAHNTSLEMEIELARMGGDEFTVLIPNLHFSEDALIVSHRIHELLRRPFVLEGRDVVMTASIGIAIYPDDGQDAATLLKHADTAMYHAKNRGRDNSQFYSASLTKEAMRRLTLENNLRTAIAQNEFSLVYQPQLDVTSGRIKSLEALIRWNHPTQGLISPVDFIPIAEENGLVIPIGEWVLRTACNDIAHWQKTIDHPLRVAVNLSAIQFRDTQLSSRITSILADTNISPQWLELEVTEGALMESNASTLATLTALREIGMHLSLDDFGTGYSCLSYLKSLPLNTIKVDQSFVRGLPTDTDSLAIIRTIISLSRNLGFTVTAEGIETINQARILHSMGCEMLQGYYISKPVPAVEIPDLLKRHWALDESPCI